MFVLTLDSYLKACTEVYKTPHIAFQCGWVLTIFDLLWANFSWRKINYFSRSYQSAPRSGCEKLAPILTLRIRFWDLSICSFVHARYRLNHSTNSTLIWYILKMIHHPIQKPPRQFFTDFWLMVCVMALNTP